ncbi:MAG: hypothetical protein OXG91_04405 [bacterium]|nr:hypothetical protein [bacterium]
MGRAHVSARVEQWLTLVSAAPRRYVAADLYAGEYWRAGMEMASRVACSGEIQVSAISAGLGLVDISDKVPMYEATLAPRHPDSVLKTSASVTSSQVRRQWWDELTRAKVLRRHGPQCLADFGEDRSATSVVVCAGRHYVDAAAADLMSLAERLGDPEKVIIFASGTPLGGLEESWVTVAGSLRLTLGGSLSSTNLRAARAVLAELGALSLGADRARRIVDTLTATAGKLPFLDRRRQQDDEILDWILDRLAEDPHATKTAALRRLRDEGRACEQVRFGRLFVNAQEMAR